MYAGECAEYVRERAMVQTMYLGAPPTPKTVYELHFLSSFPHTAWQVTRQMVEQVWKGVYLPCEAYREAKKEAAARGSSSPISISHPYRFTDVSFLVQAQSILALLMRRYFAVRKYAAVLALYEVDHATLFSPPFPPALSAVLLLIQSYTWQGNLSSALDLMHRYAAGMNPWQRVQATAFMCHFLEAHVLKSLQQAKRKAEIAQSSSSSTPAARSLPPSPPSSLFHTYIAPKNIRSTEGPIVSLKGAPLYLIQSGFTLLAPSLSSSEADVVRGKLNPLDESQWEQREVESWKVAAMRVYSPSPPSSPLSTSPSSSSSSSSFFLPVSSSLFDDAEFLQAPFGQTGMRSGGPGGGVQQQGQEKGEFGYLSPSLPSSSASSSPSCSSLFPFPFTFSFSFGMGSPAFSSYATTSTTITPTVRMGVEGGVQENHDLDPLIVYQMKQIHSLLDEIMRNPADLLFDPTTGRCDLRTGVSFNRGRCILYLVSLWIKSQVGPTRTYEFLLPRSLLKQRIVPAGKAAEQNSSAAAAAGPGAGATADPYVSDLEQVMMRSYTAEYICAQYFPSSASLLQVRAIEPMRFRASLTTLTGAATATAPDSGTENLYTAPGVKDAFGRLVDEQPFVVFSVSWP
jgi:hypothetical protein